MWFKKINTIALLSASVAGVFAFASVTKANSIQVSGVTTTLNDGVWDTAYTMSLRANHGVSATKLNGSSLLFSYDVYGLTGTQASFTAGTTAVSDWNVVVENTSGALAGGLKSLVSQGGTNVSNDLNNVPKARFLNAGTGLTATATSAIGTGHLYSTHAPGLYGQYAARWIGLTGNTEVNSQSPLMPASAVPVPTAAWMGVSMLVGLGFFYRARRRAGR
jgi:hypothetical protein